MAVAPVNFANFLLLVNYLRGNRQYFRSLFDEFVIDAKILQCRSQDCPIFTTQRLEVVQKPEIGWGDLTLKLNRERESEIGRDT